MDRDIQNYMSMTGGGRMKPTVNYEQFFRAPQQAQKPKGNQLLKTLLSIGGGTAGAILGTIAAPGAGTAAGGALGSGLGTALGRAVGRESVLGEGGLQEIGLDALLGGAFSGFGKAAKAAKAGQSALKIGGKELGRQTIKGVAEDAGVAVGKKGLAPAIERGTRQAVIAPGTQSIFKTAPQQAASADWVRRYNLSGSALRKFENINPIINQLSNQVDDILRPITKTVPTSTLKKTIGDISKKLPKGERMIFDDAIADVLKGTANKTTLAPIEVNQILRNVNKSFSGIFGKNVKGQQLSQAQYGAEKVRKTLKGIIDDLGGEAVKPINKDLAIGLQIQEELFKTKAAKNLRVPILGTEIPKTSQIGQSLADVINRRAAQSAGGQVAARPLTLTGALTRQAVAAGTAGAIGGQGQPEQPGMTDNQITNEMIARGELPASEAEMFGQGDMGTMGDMGGIDEGAQQQADIDAYFQGLALEDLQQTGGKRLTAIKNAYDLFGGGKAEKKSISQQNAERKLRQARGVVDTLEQELRAAGGPGGFGRVVERGLANIPELGGTISPRVAAFENARQGSLALISKALGESGVLTDQDIKRALNFVPTITDSPEQAARKFRILRSYLDLGSEGTVGTDTRFNF